MVSNSFANIGNKIHKTADVLSSESIRDLHLKLVSQIYNPSEWLKNSNEYNPKLNDDIVRFEELNSIESMMVMI